MEKLRTFWFLSVLCLTGLNSALTEEENSYFVVGGTLNLRPRVSEAITNIVWKLKVDMVAEWVEGKLDEVYPPFVDRAFMDKTTGSLEIKNMTEADAGLYSVEINRKVQGQRYKAIAIMKVPKPSAVVRPLTCSHGSGSCTLSCDGETEGAEPVTYSWKMDDGEWEQSGKERDITEPGDAHVEKFYCRIKNPVSEEQSGPEKNPFFKEKEPSNTGAIIVVVSVPLILIAAAIAVVGLWKKRCH